MQIRRDILILVGLFIALVAFIALGPAQTDSGPIGQATSHASGPDGALALYRWLGELGYDARRLEYQPFALDETASLLFVLAPTERYERESVEAALSWVEAGGTLVVAEDRLGAFGEAQPLLRALEVRLAEVEGEPIERAAVLQPAIGDPAARSILARTRRTLVSERADLAPLAGAPAGPVLAGVQRGAGYIYLSSAIHPFTNAGLRDPDNAAVVLNLLRRARPGGQILFDEIHHGFVSQPSLRGLLLSSPWGWAALYALGVLAAYLIATGRRFGSPVPLREEVVRRSSAEYLESMAGLLRRGAKGGYILDRYRAGLKRRLARPYGLNPGDDDDLFVAELAQLRPIDAAGLRALLGRMRRGDASEEELVRIVAEADRIAESS